MSPASRRAKISDSSGGAEPMCTISADPLILLQFLRHFQWDDIIIADDRPAHPRLNAIIKSDNSWMRSLSVSRLILPSQTVRPVWWCPFGYVQQRIHICAAFWPARKIFEFASLYFLHQWLSSRLFYPISSGNHSTTSSFIAMDMTVIQPAEIMASSVRRSTFLPLLQSCRHVTDFHLWFRFQRFAATFLPF